MRLLLLTLALIFPICALAQAEFNSDADNARKEIQAATTCDAASKSFHDNMWGSSADVGFSGIVVTKCEPDFLSKLSKSGNARYEQEKDLCFVTYFNGGGTLYLSEAASCTADLALHYSNTPSLRERVPLRASFDCSLARTQVEKDICADQDLGNLDIALSRNYQQALHQLAKDQRAFRTDERAWLKATTDRCLTSATRAEQERSCLKVEFHLRAYLLNSCTEDPESHTVTEVTPCLHESTDDLRTSIQNDH